MKRKHQDRRLIGFIACGLAGSIVSMAAAQPTQINGTGATLLENLFAADAVTNDFIDVDGDGVRLEQLAPAGLCGLAVPPPDMHWAATYRVVGSGNGFFELRDWGWRYATGPDLDPNFCTLTSSFADRAFCNRTNFVEQIAGTPTPTGAANLDNAGAYTSRTLTDGSYAVTTGTGPGTGIQIDFASLDVPVSWFTTTAGTPTFNAVPGSPGYGLNPRTAVNKDGSTASEESALQSLEACISSGGSMTLNVDTANPDEFTIFDTPLTLAPVGAPVNYGVGMSQIDMSDLRHLAATGRRITGENLVKVTRDVGSGTRNAFMNGIGLDPSWGVGENIGDRTVDSLNDLLGPNFQPSNKGGSSRVDNTVFNHRLAIGHTGAERGQSFLGIRADFLAVRADIKGGTVYARPSLANVLDGGPNGYNITGPATLATIGDPLAAPAELGGYGMMEPFDDFGADGQSNTSDPGEGNGTYDLGEPFGDVNGSGVRDQAESRPADLNPAPRNPQVSAYVNNITRSVAAFETLPGGDATFFSPGEFIASRYVPVAAATSAPATNPLAGSQFIPLIPNPSLNQSLQDFVATLPVAQGGNVLQLPQFESFTDTAGNAPTRTAGVDYSDGATGSNYISQGGTLQPYNASLARRNKIAGDFNGDFARNIEDAEHMVRAWNQRIGDGTLWVAPSGTGGEPGTDAIIEVLGDFNGDGRFDTADVRYWADGLAIAASGPKAGLLDRAAGYAAVDAALSTISGGVDENLFDTTLATGAAYSGGGSRADIARPGVSEGSFAITRGFQPNGADGVVDAHDIDYIYAQYSTNAAISGGAAEWSNTGEAAWFDLSADVTGDLIVDGEDVRTVVEDILGTNFGDVNLDGAVDGADLAIAQGNLGNAGGWADGDVNGDGVVTQEDLDMITPACPCEFDSMTGVDVFDLLAYLDLWFVNAAGADIDGAAGVNVFDLLFYLDCWFPASSGSSCP